MGSARRTGATILVSGCEIKFYLPTGGTGAGLGGSGSGGGTGFGGVGAGGGLGFTEGSCGMLGKHRTLNVQRSTFNSNIAGSLQPFAVNLVYANKASDEIPVLLIRKSARFRRPDQLARRF